MRQVIGAHSVTTVTAQRIAALLRPASIALVGASDTPGSLGDVVRRNLAEGGFGGAVYYVNPRHDSIAGQTVLRSVLDLPEAPDLALILAPAATVPGIIGDCGCKGIRAAVVVSAGFRDGGGAGGVLEREHYPIVPHRVCVLGEGTGGTVAAAVALLTGRMVVQALARNPRQYAKMKDFSLPLPEDWGDDKPPQRSLLMRRASAPPSQIHHRTRVQRSSGRS